MPKQIIDFEVKGNQVKFWLGENGSQWGDDWDDVPYEHNAGEVYDEFKTGGSFLKTFPYEDLILQPSDGLNNSEWCKQDMVQRKVPCVIRVPARLTVDEYTVGFDHYLGMDGVDRIYFGDTREQVEAL